MKVWESAAIIAKNKLVNDKPFIVLAEIHHEKLDTPIYLARNNEDVIWRGKTWTRLPFTLTPTTVDGKTMPSVKLSVSNVGGLIQSYIQQLGGLYDAKVSIYLVYDGLLDNPTPLDEFDFANRSTSYDEQNVTFELSCSPEIYNAFPLDKYMQNYCKFMFKSIRCGYTGDAKPCNNTLKECRIRERFGGEPGMVSNYG